MAGMIIDKDIFIKRYLLGCGGPTPEFWERIWQHSPITLNALALCADERLVRECAFHLPPKAKLLEGGCGSGSYLARFAKMGYQVVGIDFAQRTVERLTAAFPQLDVRVGDIRDLPFHGDTFDGYYSGGVIEHFEDGLMPQVEEACRVLKPGGVFLVTVPHMNVVRKLSSRFFGSREKVDLDGRATYIEVRDDLNLAPASQTSIPDGFVFHEYLLPATYMRHVLTQAGFIVEKEMPFSSRWGLLDLEPIRRVMGIGLQTRHAGHRMAAALLRLIDFIESKDSPLFIATAGFIGRLLGNLQLYVARKPHSPHES